MTQPRDAKLAIPSEVAANKVGNILGWAIHTAVNAPTTPNLAQPTSAGKAHPGSVPEIKMRMLVPASVYKVKKNMKIFLTL